MGTMSYSITMYPHVRDTYSMLHDHAPALSRHISTSRPVPSRPVPSRPVVVVVVECASSAHSSARDASRESAPRERAHRIASNRIESPLGRRSSLPSSNSNSNSNSTRIRRHLDAIRPVDDDVERRGIPTHASIMWTPEEDDRLRALIERHGARRWKDLAQKLGNKTAKQCRRRYTGHLTTALKEHEWTAEEDEALLRAHEELGNKWTAIAKTVGGRTDNGAKNRFKALMQKMNASKRGKKRGTPTTSPRAGAGAGTPTRGRRRVGTRTRESVEDGARDVGDDGDGRRGKRRVASTTRARRGGAAKRAKTTPTSPASPSKMRASLDELAARQNGANGISPTLFVSSPTNSVSAFDRTAAWRPVLTVNASSREHSAAGASGDAPTSPGAFARCYSVGKTLSLSCAELELLKEVQEMIIPHGMSQSHGGARSNASAFVRFPNGAGELSQGTADAQHVMNWLLSATPGAADAPQDGSKKTGARGASSRDDGGSIKVSLVPNEDGSDAVERGATLKHFLSRKAESLTPKFGANGSGRLTSVPSFTQSELNLLLNALGSTPSAANTPRARAADASTTNPFKDSTRTETPRRASTRRTRASPA